MGDARTLVYCKHCSKTHAVRDDETPCSPGAWVIEDSMVAWSPAPPPATPDPVAALRIATEALIRCSALLCHRVADEERKDDCGTCPPCNARRALASTRKLAPPETMKGG